MLSENCSRTVPQSFVIWAADWALTKLAVRFFAAIILSTHCAPAAESKSAPGVLPQIIALEPAENDFFSKELFYEDLPIKAPAVVVDEALYAAHDKLLKMLRHLPMVACNLSAASVELHIIGRNQVTTDLPEWRQDKGKPLAEYHGLTRDQRTRGMGGRLTSCGEENLLKLQKDRYFGRDICVHEFAHSIRNYGIPREVREQFADRKSTRLNSSHRL